MTFDRKETETRAELKQSILQDAFIGELNADKDYAELVN